MDKIKSKRSTVTSPLYGGEKRALRAGLDQLSNKPNSNLDINSNTYYYTYSIIQSIGNNTIQSII